MKDSCIYDGKLNITKSHAPSPILKKKRCRFMSKDFFMRINLKPSFLENDDMCVLGP